MCMCIIQTLHLDKSSSPSDKVMMYKYVGAGIIVFLIIISIVAGIIYKRFRNRGKCYLIKYNIKDATVIIATIVKDTTLMIHMDIIVNIILFDNIRNTWSNSYLLISRYNNVQMIDNDSNECVHIILEFQRVQAPQYKSSKYCVCF